VARPGKKGEGETHETVPIIVWDGPLGTALLALPEGAALTVLGRISAREWTAPGGAVKTFVEIIGENVTADVAARGEPRAPAPAPRLAPEPVAAPARPGGPTRREPSVPF
jgi:hypothetical protein